MRRRHLLLTGCHRVLLAIHPASFRRRHAAAAHELYRQWLASAPDRATRRRRAWRGVLQAWTTLFAAWGRALRRAASDLGRVPASVTGTVREGARTAVRQWRSRPLRTSVVVLTMAIAIGANTALFAVANALLLRALPYEQADRIVLVEDGTVITWGGDGGFEIDEAFATLPGLESVTLYAEGGSANLTGAGDTRRIRLTSVRPGFFSTFGVRLPLGRTFLPSDEGADVAVLGHALWVAAYGSDPGVVGRDLHLNGRSYTVVGVAPPEVSFPRGTELWLTTPARPEFFGNAIRAVGAARLAPGTGLAAINSLLADRYEVSLAEWEAQGYEMQPPRLIPLREGLVEEIHQPLLALLGAAVLVFLLGGLNLAGVWLNQALERADELQLRRALGASRGRIFGQLVAETGATGLLGGAAALVAAAWAVDALASRIPDDVPGIGAIAIDGTAVLVALALVTTAGLGFGGLAAFRGTRLHEGLVRRGVGQPGPRRLLGGLVVLQGALALTLVVGALLTVRSFQALVAVPLGFDPEGVVSFQMRIPATVAGSDDERRAYVDELEERLRRLPGATRVGLASTAPLSMELSYAMQVRRPGQEVSPLPMAMVNRVSPDYFLAAGIPVLEGRAFAAEREADPGVIIDRPLAQQLFGDEPAVGRTIEQAGYDGEQLTFTPLRVRAVVGQVHTFGPRMGAYPSIYIDLREQPSASLGVMVRAAGNPAALASAARAAAFEVSPEVAPYNLRTMRAAARDLLATDATLAVVGSSFSVAAIVLAALGLYGLMAMHVTRSRHDFGVRLALGAVPGRLVRTAIRKGAMMGIGAILIGLPVALATTRALRSRLYGIEPTDPLTLTLACAFVLGISVLAAWIPARRIMAIDPREALAAE